jgi:hypothetical protein
LRLSFGFFNGVQATKSPEPGEAWLNAVLPPKHEFKLTHSGLCFPIARDESHCLSTGERHNLELERRTAMSESTLHPKHPERICWGCEKYCPANHLNCRETRVEHPVEFFGIDWWKPNSQPPFCAETVPSDRHA